MGKRRILTELEKLDIQLDNNLGKDKVFFTDIALAFAADIDMLHKRYEFINNKLRIKLSRERIQAIKDAP